MRLLLLLTLGLVLWTGRAADEDQRRRAGGALAALAAAQPQRRLGAGARLHADPRDRPLRAADDGDLHPRAALRRPARQDRLQGDAEAGRATAAASTPSASSTWSSSAPSCSATGTLLRLLDLAGVGPLPDMPGIAAVIVPLLGLFELRRLLQDPVRGRAAAPAPARLPLRGRRRARTASPTTATCRRGWSTPAPPASAWSPRRRSRSAPDRRSCCELDRRRPAPRTRSPPRSRCAAAARSRAASWSAPRSLEIDPDSRLRLMEWCYVVCSHERLRGHRPAAPPLPESEAIVVSLDDYRDAPIAARPRAPAWPGQRDLARARRLGFRQHPGEVSEWLKERDWKSRGRG